MKSWFAALQAATAAALLATAALAAPATAEPAPMPPPPAASPPPIIDMHIHARAPGVIGPDAPTVCAPYEVWPRWDASLPDFAGMVFNRGPCAHPLAPAADAEAVMTQTLAIMERRNILAVVVGRPQDVAEWKARAPGRVIAGLDLRLHDRGPPTRLLKALSVDELEALRLAGQIQVLGEVMAQYEGAAPDDPRLEPYWAWAEAHDIPVGIHMGPGGGADAYSGGGHYRVTDGDPLKLEPVLVRHPKLRVWIMHAGYPMGENLRALMFAHPQVYVDISAINFSEPRAAFWRWLQALVEAGFGDRIMFGTDQGIWPQTIEVAIASVEDAPFLDAGQKRDILYNNAARFLRVG